MCQINSQKTRFLRQLLFTAVSLCLLDNRTATLAADIIVANSESNYQAAFFDQYAPQNALDMINRLPGFSFDEGAEDIRGFGGAGGNVLINGARPTAKSGGLTEVLKRIPAAQVDRIEILRGGGAGEAAGKTTVANIIKKKSSVGGTWGLKLNRTVKGIRPEGNATFSRKLGTWDATFGLDFGNKYDFRSAILTARDTDNKLTSSEEEGFLNRTDSVTTTFAASRPLAGGDFTINARFVGENWFGDTDRRGFIGHAPDGGAHDTLRQYDEDYTRREGELGIDWAKTYNNDWKLHLLGLGVGRYETYVSVSDFTDTTTSGNDVSIFDQDYGYTEFIGRATYGKTGSAKLKPEYGFEFANNRLNGKNSYVANGVDIPLGAANVVVQELRGEAFANLNYQANSKLSFDGGLTIEVSQIKVTGDAKQTQNLKFLKPRLSATFSFNDRTQLTVTAERKVGQLNFDDFAASSQGEDDRTTSGNPDLQPDKETRISATLDWKFNDRGSLKLKPFYAWQSDILEQIILPTGDQGKGNAGTARVWGVDANLTMPVDFLIKGGLITALYSHQNSSFNDPVLGGATRHITHYFPDYFKVEFRQDLTGSKFSWGTTLKNAIARDTFKVDEIQSFRREPLVTFFVETTRFFGVKARLELARATSRREIRTRFFYDGDRSGDFLGSETSKRKRRAELRFEVTGTF